MKASIIRKYIGKIVPLIAIVILWALLSYLISNPIILPGPLSTGITLIDIIRREGFILSVYLTFKRVIVGFLISLFLGTILGIASGVSKRVNYFFDPWFHIIRTIPTIAVIIIAIIWLDSERAPLFVSFLVVFPVIYTSVLGGIRNVNLELLEMADIYEVGFKTKVKDLYFPSLLSYLFVGIRSSISLGIKATVAAEVISQPLNSIGTNMQRHKINFDIEGVFAWVIVIVLLSYIFDWILGLIQTKLEDWKE